MYIRGHKVTYRLLASVCESVGISVDSLALDLVGPSTIVTETASSQTNVDLCHRQRLSVVETFDRSKGVQVLLNQFRQLVQVLSSLLRCDLPPRAFEGLTSSRDGDVDILLGGLMNRGDDLLGA